MKLILPADLLYRFKIETPNPGQTTNLLLSLPYNIEWNMSFYPQGIEVSISEEDLISSNINLQDLLEILKDL